MSYLIIMLHIVSILLIMSLVVGCTSEDAGPQEFIRGEYTGKLSNSNTLIYQDFFYEISTRNNNFNSAIIDTIYSSLVNIRSHFDQPYQLTIEEYLTNQINLEEFIKCRFLF